MFGKLIEQELLGDLRKETHSFERLHDIETEYMGFRPAIDYVKSHQRGDPAKPTRFFPRSIIEEIRKSGSLGDDVEGKLSFYTAVGSALDRYHGIDAFLEYSSQSGKNIRVTLDVTTNPNKDSYKADVIIILPSEGLDPSDPDYKDLISGYAEEITDQILTKSTK